MNRFRIDLIRRANGLIVQRFFTNESSSSNKELPARQASPATQTTFLRPPNITKLDETADIIRNITMNKINVNNHERFRNEDEYIFQYIHKRLEERYAPNHQGLPEETRVMLDRMLQSNSRIGKNDDGLISQRILSTVDDMDIDAIESLLIILSDHNDDWTRQIVRAADFRLSWIIKNRQQTNLDQCFFIADLLYNMRKRSIFIETLERKLLLDPYVDELTNQQLLHLLFLVILGRKNKYLLSRYEKRIFDLISNATIEDLSIICSAYFKTKTIIDNRNMIDKILMQTEKNIPNIDPSEPAYCSIIKSIRYSRDQENRDSVVRLMSSLVKYDEKFMFASPYNAVHTTKLMESFRIYEPRILHMLRCLIFKNLEKFRIKDIQYALTSLSNFCYMDLKPDQSLVDDFDKLISVLMSERREDRRHQYYHLIPILRAFAIFGYHNKDLISYTTQIMSSRYNIRNMREVLEYEKSTLLVHEAIAIEAGSTDFFKMKDVLQDCSAAIERSGNLGPLDNNSFSGNSVFRLPVNNRRLPNSEMFRTMAKSLSNHELLKNNGYNFNFQFTFAHQNYGDLVITLNEQEPGSFDRETLLPRPVSTRVKPCLVFAVRKTDFIDGHDRLVGYKHLLLRLLTKLGYSVLTVDLKQPDIDNLAQNIKNICKE